MCERNDLAYVRWSVHVAKMYRAQGDVDSNNQNLTEMHRPRGDGVRNNQNVTEMHRDHEDNQNNQTVTMMMTITMTMTMAILWWWRSRWRWRRRWRWMKMTMKMTMAIGPWCHVTGKSKRDPPSIVFKRLVQNIQHIPFYTPHDLTKCLTTFLLWKVLILHRLKACLSTMTCLVAHNVLGRPITVIEQETGTWKLVHKLYSFDLVLLQGIGCFIFVWGMILPWLKLSVLVSYMTSVIDSFEYVDFIQKASKLALVDNMIPMIWVSLFSYDPDNEFHDVRKK